MKYTRNIIPKWILVMLKGLEAQAIAGDFVIPDSEAAVEAFLK